MPYHKFIELINILKYPFDDLTTINDAFPLAYYLLDCVILSLRPQEFRLINHPTEGKDAVVRGVRMFCSQGVH